MSGGSWHYVFSHFDTVADRLSKSRKIKRRLLGKLIKEIAKAVHDIEWEDSGDIESADDSIDKVIDFNINTALQEEVKEYIEELRNIIEWEIKNE